jgi:hypothetical protein
MHVLFGSRVRLLSCAAALSVLCVLPAPRAAQGLPARLSDEAYWTLVDSFSEPNGVFQSDNLVSNERRFQDVVPALARLKRGGAYLGVAPDQNFTFILGLEPRIAFIVDIRRGNLHAHLMYKALFELSRDRAEFLSRLFARPRPPGLGPATPAAALFDAYRGVAPSASLARETTKAIEDRLVRTHGFKLSDEDLRGIEYVHGMFVQFGPDLTYSSSSGRGGRNMPTYAELQSLADVNGDNRAYLGTEVGYRALKAFQEKNLLVPIVGDFAGPKALRAVGRYLREHGATITVFYTSNVEQYLFQNGVWQEFYANVATLPIDEGSAFLRSARSLNVLDPIGTFLGDVSSGLIREYKDVQRRGSAPAPAPVAWVR